LNFQLNIAHRTCRWSPAMRHEETVKPALTGFISTVAREDNTGQTALNPVFADIQAPGRNRLCAAIAGAVFILSQELTRKAPKSCHFLCTDFHPDIRAPDPRRANDTRSRLQKISPMQHLMEPPAFSISLISTA